MTYFLFSWELRVLGSDTTSATTRLGDFGICLIFITSYSPCDLLFYHPLIRSSVVSCTDFLFSLELHYPWMFWVPVMWHKSISFTVSSSCMYVRRKHKVALNEFPWCSAWARMAKCENEENGGRCVRLVTEMKGKRSTAVILRPWS